MTGSHAVTTRNLCFSYPGETRPALHDISLNIASGSCFGLLGPNGAGKSTLLALLTGLMKPASGELQLLGRAPDAALRQQIALVPQDYAFYPALSCRENLDCFAGLYGYRGAEKQQRIDFAVASCALNDALDKRAAQCSGGLRRRLNLAIGLLNQPQILFLDEPTVGIDAQSRRFILDAIRSLQQAGMTIIYTSHYMEEIQAICDQLAIIDHGKLLLQDTLQNVLKQAESMPAIPAIQSARRLEDFYLSLTTHGLRD